MYEMQKKWNLMEDKLRVRYSKMSKIFIILVILFIIWIVFIALGIVIFEMGPNWALLTLDNWIYVWCVLIGLFIFLNLVFYFHYNSIKNKKLEKEKPKPEFINGKRLYIYSHPKGVEGGIFSKTYIQIDERSILRLRSLMIPPDELWIKEGK